MYFLSHRTLPVKHFGTAAFHDEEVQSAVPVFLSGFDSDYHA
ncbi:hypothetical protein [uncultured Bartonella sp.]|nr:hypothetical protein [uncultured Bartonella sp.]